MATVGGSAPQNRGGHPVIHPVADALPGRGRRPMQPDVRRRRISRRESMEALIAKRLEA